MKRKPAKKFQDLIVWQKSHQLVLGLYAYSKNFPKDEIYGLTSQTRRAGVSVCANIAEGFKKSTKAEKRRYLNIAQGSLEEVRYYLILAKDLGYGDNSELMEKLDEAARILEGYYASILASGS